MTKYAVLYLPSRRQEPAGRGQALGRVATAATPSPRVVEEDWDLKQASEAARSPEMAFARAMPMKLIKPMSAAAGAHADSWGIEAVGADKSPFDGSMCKVAVLDTGIDKDHIAFAGVSLEIQDFTGEGDGDNNGHGTHCAGTIFGRAVDGRRIGIARGVKTASIAKVLNADGSGSSIEIYKGLLWALERRPNVISMSIGLDFPGLVEELVNDGWPAALATSEALAAFTDNLKLFEILKNRSEAKIFGSSPLVVAAAGNESRRAERADFRITPSLPASAFDIAVGAVGPEGDKYRVADFSNAPPKLVAPGVDIVSAAAGGGLATMSGTSMACPHVAGVAALLVDKLISERQLPDAEGLRSHLIYSTRRDCIADFDHDGHTDVGRGLITAPV